MAEFGDLRISETLVIPAWELSESFVRASGPGGQHVNKVSTAVQLTWHVRASSLPADVKARFEKRFESRLTNDGRLILEVSDHRSQRLNRETARERLAGMVRQSQQRRKRRIATKPTRGSVKRRLDGKKKRSAVKALRGNVRSDE